MKKKIIIAGVTCWVVILAIFLIVFNWSKPESQTTVPSNIGITENPSVNQVNTNDYGEDIDLSIITGVWKSDRSDGNMLTLHDDMTYEDSDSIMGKGTFKINGEYLLLTDQNKTYQYVLKYQENNGSPELYFTISQYDTIYRPATEEDIKNKENEKAEKEQQQDERSSNYKKIAYQMLTTGTWTTGTESFVFSEDTFTHTVDGGSTVYNYEVSDVAYNQGDPGGYNLSWTVSQSGTNVDASQILKILFGIDGANENTLIFSFNNKEYSIVREAVEVSDDFCATTPWSKTE